MNEKQKYRERRRAARKHKVACPCGRLGCEDGRGYGIPRVVLKRREIRRGGLGD
jgi:hypothetical protein